jgi:hypothetical protein
MGVLGKTETTQCRAEQACDDEDDANHFGAVHLLFFLLLISWIKLCGED